MIAILTFLIFTGAFLAAAEISVWGPRRRMVHSMETRLRGLRSAGGRRPQSLLRQHGPSSSSIHELYGRLAILTRLQAIIDESKLPYRAPSVITFSIVLLVGAGMVAQTTQLFPFLVFRVLLAIGVACIPFTYIWIIRQRRMKLLEEMLPEAIDLFTRAMRAGHNIHSAMQVLAEESHEPLSGEFKKLVEELALGSTVEEAIHNFGNRVPLLDVRFFSIGVILQRETGANIVAVMENLSMVIRERLQLRGRLRAHTAQQRFSAGMLCGLPIFVGLAFYFVRYDYISILWLTPLGSKFLILGVISELVGILVIRKISTVKI
jgi:tight adherence protein B